MAGHGAVSPGEAMTVIGPGVYGGLLDTSATTTPGAGQTFDLSAMVGHYVMVEAWVNDIYIVFQPASATPAIDASTKVQNFTTITANRKVPTKIVAGAGPRPFVVVEGYTKLVYAGVSGTGTIVVNRG